MKVTIRSSYRLRRAEVELTEGLPTLPGFKQPLSFTILTASTQVLDLQRAGKLDQAAEVFTHNAIVKKVEQMLELLSHEVIVEVET